MAGREPLQSSLHPNLLLSFSDIRCVNQWARGDPPVLLPKLTVSSQSTFPKWKASPPQSQSSITLLPPSDCCLSSFISLLMVYKLRVMIPPLPSALGDFLWPSWFCEASFCKWAVISRASRAVCRAAERQEVKLRCVLCGVHIGRRGWLGLILSNYCLDIMWCDVFFVCSGNFSSVIIRNR